MASVQVQRSETRDEAICRLAVGARERGITVLQHEPTNEYYVESYSEPGKLHRVTAVSCTCKGFQYHGYCCHLAALLDHLGWLPVPTPPPPTVAEATWVWHLPRLGRRAGHADPRSLVADVGSGRFGRSPPPH